MDKNDKKCFEFANRLLLLSAQILHRQSTIETLEIFKHGVENIFNDIRNHFGGNNITFLSDKTGENKTCRCDINDFEIKLSDETIYFIHKNDDAKNMLEYLKIDYEL